MPSTFRKQAEREFYGKHFTSTSNAQIPLIDLSRRYYIAYLNSAQFNSQTPFDQLQVAWAKKYISNNGGTPPAGNYMSQLWRQLVVVVGAKPTSFENDNMVTFFLNAP